MKVTLGSGCCLPCPPCPISLLEVPMEPQPMEPKLNYLPPLQKPLHFAENISWPGLGPDQGAAYTGIELAIAPGRTSGVDLPPRG